MEETYIYIWIRPYLGYLARDNFFCLEWHMPGDLGDGHQQNLFQDIPPIASNDDIYIL